MSDSADAADTDVDADADAEELDHTPSTSEDVQREEAKVLAEGWLRVATVSIFAVLLTVVGLLQASGLVDLFPFGEGWTVEWLLFVVLAVALVAVEAWTWWIDRI